MAWALAWLELELVLGQAWCGPEGLMDLARWQKVLGLDPTKMKTKKIKQKIKIKYDK